MTTTKPNPVPKSTSLAKLHEAIEDIDMRSQFNARRTDALCTAAQALLRGKPTPHDLHAAIRILQLINDQADDEKDTVNCIAEGFGCNWRHDFDDYGQLVPAGEPDAALQQPAH